MEKKYSKI